MLLYKVLFNQRINIVIDMVPIMSLMMKKHAWLHMCVVCACYYNAALERFRTKPPPGSRCTFTAKNGISKNSANQHTYTNRHTILRSSVSFSREGYKCTQQLIKCCITFQENGLIRSNHVCCPRKSMSREKFIRAQSNCVY